MRNLPFPPYVRVCCHHDLLVWKSCDIYPLESKTFLKVIKKNQSRSPSPHSCRNLQGNKHKQAVLKDVEEREM